MHSETTTLLNCSLLGRGQLLKEIICSSNIRETNSFLEDRFHLEEVYLAERPSGVHLVPLFNPSAFRTAKTLWSFGHSECKRVHSFGLSESKRVKTGKCKDWTINILFLAGGFIRPGAFIRIITVFAKPNEVRNLHKNICFFDRLKYNISTLHLLNTHRKRILQI